MVALVALAVSGCGGGGGGADAGFTPAPTTTTPPGATTPTTPPTTTPTSSIPDPGTTTGTLPSVPQRSFYASWMAAMQDATASLPGYAGRSAQVFDNQTIRQVVRMSLDGDTLRIKISNLFGKTAVTYSGMRVARSDGGSAIESGSDRMVTFGGQNSVTLAAGAEAFSDPVDLSVAAFSHIAISAYFAGPTAVPTIHADARQTAYIATGNQLSAPSIEAGAANRREAYYGVSAVDVSSEQAASVVVAFGDSLTDGSGTPIDGNRRYPNLLDNRLKAAGLDRTGVVNAGIGGNRWLHDFAGPRGISRFGRDVLGVTGATHAVILMGINDIGFSVESVPDQEVSAQQIIDAMAAAVSSARTRGLKVLLGTLMPFKGAGYFSAAGEAKRQAVNAWIRTHPDVTVVDFDAVMRDPADPAALNPAYDRGDHLHPNDLGFTAMAQAIDLASLR
jgi:lysophospholipase L1-like esterase